MARDPLWRLRLKYEDSQGRCDLCASQGLIGTDIKLIPPQESEISQREEGSISFMLRCADLAACHQRRALR